jgi:hypothetical protein
LRNCTQVHTVDLEPLAKNYEPMEKREFNGIIRKYIAGHKKVIYEQNPLKFM